MTDYRRLATLATASLDVPDSAPVITAPPTPPASSLLDGDGTAALRWPWSTMDQAFAAMLPGELVTVIAGAGTGKTTFVTNALAGWTAAGVAVAMLSTEERGRKIREKMACAMAGIPERWRAEGDLTEISGLQRAQYEDALADMAVTPIIGLEDVGGKTPHRLREAVMRAVASSVRAEPLRALVLDHLHEIGPDPGGNPFEAWTNAVTILRDAAQSLGLTVVMVAQPKRVDRGPIPVMYRSPDLSDGKGAAAIEQMSDQVYGLSRCLQPMTAKEMREAVQAIREDRRSIDHYAVPETRVRCLKRRIWGEAVGRTVRLRLEHGKLVDPEPRIPF